MFRYVFAENVHNIKILKTSIIISSKINFLISLCVNVFLMLTVHVRFS